MNKMTEGSPLGLLIRFALPVLGGNLFQQFYNIVDAAIVGRILGGRALAGVGATSSVQFLILGFCFGLAIGFGIPVAQQFGAGHMSHVRKIIFHCFVLTAVIAAVITVGSVLLCDPILVVLSTPEDIYRNAYAYLFVILLGLPFTLLYNLLAAILRSVGDSKTPFLFLVFSTILNIFLDLLCIVTLGWGVAGAAIATVTAQGISGLLCLALLFRKYPELLPNRDERSWDWHRAGMLLGMGLPMGLQFSITAIGSMVMQSANNGLGSVYVSGFTAGQKIKQFAMCPFDAIATATSTFASQNYGAGKQDRVRQGIRCGLLLAVGYGLAIGLVLIFFGRSLSLIFMSGSHVEELNASGRYLRCLGYFYWVLGILNVSRMTIQGLGFPGRAILAGVIEMTARTIVSLVLVPLFGFTAICFADQSAWCTATVYLMCMLVWCVRKVERQRMPAEGS